MVKDSLGRWCWLVLLVVVPITVVCWVLPKRDAPPKRFTVEVSGAPGTRVSGSFEVDRVPQGEPEEAECDSDK